jgi:hypothetical protein
MLLYFGLLIDKNAEIKQMNVRTVKLALRIWIGALKS